MTDAATIYDEWFVPAVFAPLARQVIEQTEIPAAARVLDVACGSGIVARTIAQRTGATGRVVGLDFSQPMLDAARRAADAAELAIEFQQGSAEALPFADESFDLVFCQQGLQFFPDRPRALAEMRRVLVGGGRVTIVTWLGLEHYPLFATFDQVVQRQLGSAALEMPFALGDPEMLAELLQGAGFGNVSVEPVMIEANYVEPERFVALHVAASSAGIPALQGLEPAAREALIAGIGDELAETVREATIGDRARFPMQANVARGVCA